MDLISIIVPVYNAEKYLQKCIQSLLTQTYHNLEIIFINDGSTDNSLKILNKFAGIDNRIKIINQHNQKQGAARNRGLETALGNYITFVDSDDYIDSDYVEKMYSAIKRTNADIAISSFVRTKKDKKKFQIKINDENLFSDKQEIINHLKIPPYWFVTGKLYKKELLNNLRFEENVFYEDVGFLIRAVHKMNSLVTVPDVNYYYISNPNSTMKSKQPPAKKNDKINALFDAYNYAKENNIKLKEFPISKTNKSFYSIKQYPDRKDYYIFGIKCFSKNEIYNPQKTFVIFNTACFGDVLLCNSLCQNIKLAFPNSKTIFICDSAFYDVAINQKDVDEVICFDKKKTHKGIFGLLKFIKDFKYKKIDYAFITYKNFRNSMIANLLGTKIIISEKLEDACLPVVERHANLLKNITNKPQQKLPIRYEVPLDVSFNLEPDKKYIGLCTTSKKFEKDMPVETAAGIINKLSDYEVIFLGRGDKSVDYAQKLKSLNCKFIDLTNQTTIPQMAYILKRCEGLISVDTGTLHLGCALDVPTAAVFYETKTIAKWGPDANIYRTKIIYYNQTCENICKTLLSLI